MTRKKAVSLLLAAVLMLLAAAHVTTPAGQNLSSTSAPVIACNGCSGGGSGG
ncbi:MAG TPA: hypothetical protein PLV64_02710 [Anaerolineales bacterium]|jgi:hypothetical protein|nr:hypothetical protein [Anaerolineales bacterium]